MARVENSEAHVEEHWTRPPNHGAIANTPDFGATILGESGTQLSFTIPNIGEGETHLTLAWSESDDFEHHSVRREMVEFRIP